MRWITAWASATQAPYPFGTQDQQRQLQRVFPAACRDAGDLSFRIIARPELLAPVIRLRFTNIMSSRPLPIDGVHVGFQQQGAALVRGSNRPVLFAGRSVAEIPAGGTLWSDPVTLAPIPQTASLPAVSVSFHVPHRFGDLDWLSEAFVTSYVTPAATGAVGHDEDGYAFSEATTGRFVVDRIDVLTERDVKLIAAFGDSITAGSGSTVDGFDRWSDILSLRLQRRYGDAFAVVNLGIGGNQVMGPADYDGAVPPFAGGAPANARIEPDLFSLSGLSTVIWMQGINDFGAAGAQADAVFAAMQAAVQGIRDRHPNVRLIGGTLTPCLGSEGTYGAPQVETQRQRFNDHLRKSNVFDHIIDFDRAVADPRTGAFKEGFALGDVRGDAGDRFHPSRAGHLAMATCINLGAVAGFGTGS